MNKWYSELDKLKEMVAKGMTLEEIGKEYGVKKQRVYQVFTKYGIETPARKKKNFLRDKTPAHYWLNRLLSAKGFSKQERLFLLENLPLPEVCPVFGIPLWYDGTGERGWPSNDYSPSIDKIDPSKGYTIGNIQVISCRANRIKNDSTPEELRRLADYMERVYKENTCNLS